MVKNYFKKLKALDHLFVSCSEQGPLWDKSRSFLDGRDHDCVIYMVGKHTTGSKSCVWREEGVCCVQRCVFLNTRMCLSVWPHCFEIFHMLLFYGLFIFIFNNLCGSFKMQLFYMKILLYGHVTTCSSMGHLCHITHFKTTFCIRRVKFIVALFLLLKFYIFIFEVLHSEVPIVIVGLNSKYFVCLVLCVVAHFNV